MAPPGPPPATTPPSPPLPPATPRSPAIGSSSSSSLPALSRRACRRFTVSRSLASAAIATVLLLLIFTGAAARPASPPTSPTPGTRDRIENVGGVRAQIGPEYTSEVHMAGDAYRASTDGKKYNAVYKKLKPTEQWGEHEVAATRAAGQLISVSKDSMLQKKVGEKGLSDYVASAAKDPAARRKFQAAGDESSASAAKPKLSEPVLGPVGGTQVPGTIDEDMLKLGDKLSKYYIREACEKHGFAFRSAAAAAGQHLFRRAPPATATCGRKGSGNAGKTAATKPAVGASGKATQAKTAGMTSPAAARKPAAATAARPKKAEGGTRGSVRAAGSGRKNPGK
ncbi:hypothetical protein DFJ73DRAFT_784327 [Zopfochytrium polystomum]|nr:hypothetical protein DFJ73DRAFT_784327 [Zopfochytrium polystomum]